MSKTHTVKKGETLSKIASKYNISTTALYEANSNLIKDKNIIKIGWILKIPSETHSEGYENIGSQFCKALSDIRKVASVKKLMEMVNENE